MPARSPSFTNSTLFSSLVGRRGLLLWIREYLGKTGIEGFYIEFGVFNGESMKETFYALRDQVSKYIGLDSFCGLPALDNKTDKQAVQLAPAFIKGNFFSKGYDFVKTNLLSTGISEKDIFLVKGFFKNSLTPKLSSQISGMGTGKAAVIHLDVDLYSSTSQALEFSYPFMQSGGWLLCDDYWCYGGKSSCGTHKALEDFLKKHADIRLHEYCSYGGWSKAFIIEKMED